MGMLASQEPRMKKHVMANQHIVIITPHWLGPRVNFSLSSMSWEEVGREGCVEEDRGD